MIMNLAKYMVRFFIEQRAIDEKDSSVYIYGAELLLSTLANLLAIVSMAFFTKMQVEIAFFIVPFLFFRRTIGGYHAKTHYGCVMLMAAMLVVYIYLIRYIEQYVNISLMLFVVAVSFVLIYRFAPVEHPNKPLLPGDYSRARKKSAIMCVGLIVTLGVLRVALNETDLLIYVSLGVISSVAVMLIGKAAYSNQHNQL